ncbi:MAG: hypothetical protein J5I47_11060 [Vicingus serpentipes]|nr:hypothetical protein [Vicingus serpentipes]
MSYKCINCSNKCFEHEEDNCIAITFSNSDLDIEGGVDSLKTALVKIVEDLISLRKGICDPCNDCAGAATTSTVTASAATSNLGNVGINSSAARVGLTPIKLIIEPGITNTTIQYDAQNAIKELGSGQSLTKVEVFGTANNRSTRIYSSSSDVGSFSATPENFPVTVSIETTKFTDAGQNIMKFQKTLNNAKVSSDEFFMINDMQKVSMTSQSEVNEYLDKQVSSVRNLIKSIENVNSNGKVGFNSIFSDIRNQIDTIKKDMADTSDLDSSLDSLQKQINAQSILINTQADKIKVQEDKVKMLETLYDQLNDKVNS